MSSRKVSRHPLHPHKLNPNGLSLHLGIPGKVPANPSLMAAHSSIYSPFTPVWPLHFNNSFPLSQSFPVYITGTHCMAPLKPNPQNGSGKENKVLGVLGGKVSQVYGGPCPTWNSGPNTDQTDGDVLWSLSLEVFFPAPWSPADCGAL